MSILESLSLSLSVCNPGHSKHVATHNINCYNLHVQFFINLFHVACIIFPLFSRVYLFWWILCIFKDFADISLSYEIETSSG